MNLFEKHLDWSGGIPAVELKEISRDVMDGNIVVLKQVFPESTMDLCKAALLGWQAEHPASNPEGLQTNAHWWRRDVNPPSETSHLFETFCLAFGDKKDALFEVAIVFEEMAEVWRVLTGRMEAMQINADGKALRPQAIHYPRGGGFFDWHRHDLMPQRIGLILGLSKDGRDFVSGGTRFRKDGQEIDTAKVHDIGDICLFRYDLDHSVGEIDADYPLEWGGMGRWTMVLPLM